MIGSVMLVFYLLLQLRLADLGPVQILLMHSSDIHLKKS